MPKVHFPPYSRCCGQRALFCGLYHPGIFWRLNVGRRTGDKTARLSTTKRKCRWRASFWKRCLSLPTNRSRWRHSTDISSAKRWMLPLINTGMRVEDRACRTMSSSTFPPSQISISHSSPPFATWWSVLSGLDQVTLNQPPPASVSDSEAINDDVLVSAALEMFAVEDEGKYSDSSRSSKSTNLARSMKSGVAGVAKSPSNHLVSCDVALRPSKIYLLRYTTFNIDIFPRKDLWVCRTSAAFFNYCRTRIS